MQAEGEHVRPGIHTTKTPGARAACLGLSEGGLGRNHTVVFFDFIGRKVGQ